MGDDAVIQTLEVPTDVSSTYFDRIPQLITVVGSLGHFAAPSCLTLGVNFLPLGILTLNFMIISHERVGRRLFGRLRVYYVI